MPPVFPKQFQNTTAMYEAHINGLGRMVSHTFSSPEVKLDLYYNRADLVYV